MFGERNNYVDDEEGDDDVNRNEHMYPVGNLERDYYDEPDFKKTLWRDDDEGDEDGDNDSAW